MDSIWKRVAAEWVGTFFLVFAGCGAIMVAERFPGMFNPMLIPFCFGLAVMVMIYAVGHISGAHFNPAVTFGFAVAGRFSWRHLPVYWLAQILGAQLAMSLLVLILPPGVGFGVTVPAVSAGAAFVWEALLTFLLMFVIISVATGSKEIGVMAGMAIGAAVALDAMVGGPVTGASMNPARSLAPAIAANNFESLWIYLTAPMAGSALAALFYEKIR